MEHLPVPQDREPLVIKVPCLADAAPIYDGKDFQTFPERCGYHVLPPNDLFEELHPAEYHTIDSLQAFFQSWMYFGLLDNVLGDIDLYSRDDFVTSDDQQGGLAIISSVVLPKLIISKLCSSFIDSNGHFRRNDNSVRSSADKIIATVYFALGQLSRWEEYAESEASTWEPLLVSVRVLAETLYIAFAPACDYPPRILGPSNSMSVLPIRKHMLDHGWCIHQFESLCMRVSYLTLLYLANLRRHRDSNEDHHGCRAADKCIAYNIDDEVFQGTHTADCGGCEHVNAPVKEMEQILRDQAIPVLSCRRLPSGKLEASYCRASPALQYTAFSHLWADGLGNPNANSLPECQLERLVSTVESSRQTVSRHGYVGDVGFGISPSLGATARALSNRVAAFLGLTGDTKVVNLWLDVYCVPVLPRPANRASVEPEDDEHHRCIHRRNAASNLKKGAMDLMAATYSWADHVLVLDQELLQMQLGCSELEFLARLGTCAWNTRCWTYQEHALGRIAAYQCQDGVSFCHVAGNREREDAILWRSRPLKNEERILGIHVDLEALAMPLDVNTGATTRNWRLQQPWRSIDPDIRRFTNAWNAFVGRTTTKASELRGLLASLLDLSAVEILNPELDDDGRTKAIFAAQTKLPLSFLFVEMKRRLSQEQRDPRAKTPSSGQGTDPESETLQRSSIKLQERWLPVSLDVAVPIWDRSFGFHFHVTPDGLLLKPAEICRSTNPLLLRLPVMPGSNWIFDIGPSRGRVDLDRDELDHCLTSDTDEVILVLDTSLSRMNDPRGACLLPQAEGQAGITKATYVGPVRWRRIDNTAGDCEHVQGTLINAQDNDILISCDINSWPKLRLKRHQISNKGARVSLKTVKWMLVAAAVPTLCLLLSIPLTVLFTPIQKRRSLGPQIFSALAIMILTVPIALLVTSTMERARQYILLNTLAFELDSADPWWKTLSGVLPASSLGATDPLERVHIAILKMAVVVARSASRLRARWTRTREGAIQLA